MSMAAPRVATRQPSKGKVSAFPGAVFLNGLFAIFGARRCIAAGRAKQRGDGTLVKADEREQYRGHDFIERPWQSVEAGTSVGILFQGGPAYGVRGIRTAGRIAGSDLKVTNRVLIYSFGKLREEAV